MTIPRRFTRLLLLLLPAAVFPAAGQDVSFLASNRAEYRWFREDGREDLVNRLHFDLGLAPVTAGGRIEWFQPSSGPASDSLTQRYLEYRSGGMRIRAGNFYKRVGRGLIFHAFEKQQIALDRVEQSFHVDRNLDGFLADWDGDRFSLSLFTGVPSWMEQTTVRGADTDLRIMNRISLGGAFLRVNRTDRERAVRSEIRSARLGLGLPMVDVFAEYAVRNGFPDRHDPRGEAFYASVNLSRPRLGVNLEYKSYRRFDTGLNSPPTLVREHAFTLLNRLSHVLRADDETGFRGELFLQAAPSWMLTLYYSRGGPRSGGTADDFAEIYGEAVLDPSGGYRALLFFDRMRDRTTGLSRALTAGFEGEVSLTGVYSLLAQGQFQRLTKSFYAADFGNRLLLVALSRAMRYTLGIQWEWTDDPYSVRKRWVAAHVNIRLGDRHDLMITAGERRAGLACSSGVCLLLPEFRGVEARLYSRF